MSDNLTQPTVLVKKADGTMVHMTLDEVRQMRAKDHPPQAAPAALPVPTPTSVVSIKEPVVSPSDVKTDQLIEEKKDSLAWSTDDHKSLLDPSFHGNLPMVESSTVLATTTPVGKIFLNEAAASMAKESRISNLESRGDIGVTPQNKIPNSKFQIPNSPNAKEDFVKKWANDENMWKVPELKAKTTLQDVVSAPMPQNMSPVDELHAFSITDFRRLGPSPIQVVPAIMEKFQVLKEESYLLYLDALDAWQSSPLYQGYLNLAAEALRNRKSLEVVLSEQPDKLRAMKIEEWKAVGSVNKQLM